MVERAHPADVQRSADPHVEPSPEGLTCPRCGKPLAAANYAYDSGIFINRCAACNGVWLERGQLEQLARHRVGTAATRELADAYGKEIHQSHRWDAARKLLRSRVLSGGFAVAYLFFLWNNTGHLGITLRYFRFLLFPIACIWFCDALGRRTYFMFGHFRPITRPTFPADLVAIGGWLLLLLAWVFNIICQS